MSRFYNVKLCFCKIDQSINRPVNLSLYTTVIMHQNHWFLTLILTYRKIPSQSSYKIRRSPVLYKACCASFEKDTWHLVWVFWSCNNIKTCRRTSLMRPQGWKERKESGRKRFVISTSIVCMHIGVPELLEELKNECSRKHFKHVLAFCFIVLIHRHTKGKDHCANTCFLQPLFKGFLLCRY